MNYDVIIKGRLIDCASDAPVENGLVAVAGERIVYAGEAAGFAMQENAEVVEAGTVLPGFMDCHAHLGGNENAGDFADGAFFGDQLLGAAYQCSLILDAGFTGVRDMSEAGIYLSRAQERGILLSPRIFPAGRMLSVTSGHGEDAPYLTKAQFNAMNHGTRLCDGADDCMLAAREQFRIGARFIKLHATGGVSSQTDGVNDVQFSPQELLAIVDEAKRHGTYVAAHCTGNEGAYQALKAGVMSIEHGVMLTGREIDLMAQNGATLVTTLAIALHVADFPGIPDWLRKKAENAAERNMKTIKMAREAGVRIAFGSDFTNSRNTSYSTLGREFVAMTEAGMTSMEALKAGTANAAHLMKNEENTGTLTAGKLADIVLVDGDPVKNIACLADAKNISAVYMGGKKVK